MLILLRVVLRRFFFFRARFGSGDRWAGVVSVRAAGRPAGGLEVCTSLPLFLAVLLFGCCWCVLFFYDLRSSVGQVCAPFFRVTFAFVPVLFVNFSVKWIMLN